MRFERVSTRVGGARRCSNNTMLSLRASGTFANALAHNNTHGEHANTVLDHFIGPRNRYFLDRYRIIVDVAMRRSGNTVFWDKEDARSNDLRCVDCASGIRSSPAWFRYDPEGVGMRFGGICHCSGSDPGFPRDLLIPR